MPLAPAGADGEAGDGLDQPYHITSLQLLGEATEEEARITATVWVAVHTDAWVRVRLAMPEGLLGIGAYEHEGPEDADHFPAGRDAQGYVWQLRGQGEHVLRLRLRVPVERAGGESLLQLTIPRAVADAEGPAIAQSELRLRVPGENVVAREASAGPVPVERAAGARDALPRPPAGARAAPQEGEGDVAAWEIVVIGLPDQLRLSWRTAPADASADPVLVSDVNLRVSLDGRTVHVDAACQVRSLEGQFDGVQMRLPAGFEVLGVEGAAAVVVGNAEQTPEGGTLVDFRRSEAALAPLEFTVQLRAPAPAPGEPLTLQGFDIAGAVRQRGYVAFSVVGDYSLEIVDGESVRQVDPLTLSAPLRDAPVTAALAFDNQPFAIGFRLHRIEPYVVAQIDSTAALVPSAVTLDVEVRYTVLRAGVRWVTLDWPGWQAAGWVLDPSSLGPAVVVDRTGVEMDANELRVPIHEAAGAGFTIRFRAERPVDVGVASLDCPLPVPRAHAVESSRLVLYVAPSLSFTPGDVMPEPTGSLLGGVEVVPRPTALAAGAGPAQVFHWSGDEQPRLAGEFSLLPQQIALDIDTTVEVFEGAGRVVQTFSYNISHEPLETVDLLVPAEAVDPRLFLANLDDPFPLEWEEVTATDEDADAGAERRLWRAVLPSDARLGSVGVRLQYGLPGPSDGENVEWSVPLAVPAVPADDAWEVSSTPITFERDAALEVVSMRIADAADSGSPVRAVSLDLRRLSQAWPSPLLFPLVLYETTVRPDGASQTRAALVLETSLAEVEFRLPDGASLGGLLVEGQVPPYEELGEGRYRIRLTPPHAPPSGSEEAVAAPGSRRSLPETRYRLVVAFESAASAPGLLGEVRARPIEFASRGARVCRVYWRIMLPRTHSWFAGADRYNHEWSWQWRGAALARMPLVSRSELAHGWGLEPDWLGIGESSRTEEGYLLSTVGEVVELHVVVVHQTLLLLLASGTALLVGLVLTTVPAARHPAALVLMAVAAAVAVALWPDQAVLLGQASLLGVAIALVWGIGYGALHGRRRGRVAPALGLHSRLSPDRWTRRVRAPGSSSTAPAGGSAGAPSGESDGTGPSRRSPDGALAPSASSSDSNAH